MFLMTRVREESEHFDTRPGIPRGLAVTGGVITSAGVVPAAPENPGGHRATRPQPTP